LKKKDFGQVPKYLTENRYKIENEYKVLREQKARAAEEEAKKNTLLSEEELNTLREGLNKKLEHLKREYAIFTHKSKIDTLKQKAKKEGIEKEMLSVEKDLQTLSKRMIYVDMTINI
jgi:hypothetical protein